MGPLDATSNGPTGDRPPGSDRRWSEALEVRVGAGRSVTVESEAYIMRIL